MPESNNGWIMNRIELAIDQQQQQQQKLQLHHGKRRFQAHRKMCGRIFLPGPTASVFKKSTFSSKGYES